MRGDDDADFADFVAASSRRLLRMAPRPPEPGYKPHEVPKQALSLPFNLGWSRPRVLRGS